MSSWLGSGYSSHNGATGTGGGSTAVSTSMSLSPSMYGSTSSSATMAGLTTTLTNSSSIYFPHSSSASTANDLALNLGHQNSVAHATAAAAALRTSTLNAPVSMLPPLSPLSLPALPLDALNAVGQLNIFQLKFFSILTGKGFVSSFFKFQNSSVAIVSPSGTGK